MLHVESVLVLLIVTNQADAVTGLILIRRHQALGNANDVANVRIETLRKIGRVMFQRKYTWTECNITDYFLHPEYNTGVKNTLALIKFTCEEQISWSPVGLPTAGTKLDNVYSVGFTDENRWLQQVSNRMEAVTDADCKVFYKKEKLDYQCLQPSHSICYKIWNSTKPCVLDAGAALASKSRDGIWTAIGISTFGPGCSLPSRFIQLLPYTSWIASHRPVNARRGLRTTDDAYREQLWEPRRPDADVIFFEKLTNNTIVMRPSYAYMKEVVHGSCTPYDGQLIYREFGTIKRTPPHRATGIYSISMYDLFMPQLTCVMVTVMCERRSDVRFWFSSGFGKEDTEDFIRYLPVDETEKRDRIWYVKDIYQRYENTSTKNLELKFEFAGEAKLDVEFYGKNFSGYSLKSIPLRSHLPDDNPQDVEDLTNDSFYTG